jgi:hypothetical protein
MRRIGRSGVDRASLLGFWRELFWRWGKWFDLWSLWRRRKRRGARGCGGFAEAGQITQAWAARGLETALFRHLFFFCVSSNRIKAIQVGDKRLCAVIPRLRAESPLHPSVGGNAPRYRGQAIRGPWARPITGYKFAPCHLERSRKIPIPPILPRISGAFGRL